MILDTPDDIADKLSIFTFEMADPEQDLSVQQPGCGATTFTCFPKLTLELRLIIWRAAFPRGRMVQIEAQLKDYAYYGPPLPSTLMVNRESRRETLRNYLLCYQDDELLNRVPVWEPHLRSKDLQQQPRPVCYNPGRDLLFVPTWPMEGLFTNAFLKLLAEKCKPIGKVRVLACDYINYCPKWGVLRPNSRDFCGLTNFHDIKELYYIKDRRVNLWPKTHVITKALDKAFDLEREKFPCLNKPKISFFDSMHDLERNMHSQGW